MFWCLGLEGISSYMKQALGAREGSIPPLGSSGNENIFVKDARAHPAHKHLVQCESISKLKFTCPYPPKTQHVGTLLHRHITPQDSWCVPAWGSVCHKRQIVRCVGRAWSTPALLTSLWKQRWGQSRQAWHLETTLIKSNFLILEGRETRSDSLLATALQF